MIQARVVEGSAREFSPSSFFRRLLEVSLGDQVVLTSQRHQAQLDVGIFGPSLLRTAAEGLDSRLTRHQGRLVRPLTSLHRRLLAPERGKGIRSVWLTGENVRPPNEGWDLTLSFDLDPLGGTNVYCPVWWGEVGLIQGAKSNTVDRLGRELTLEELLSSRATNVNSRPGFVCAFINNPEPMRMRAISLLERLGKVDVFGRVSGRPAGPKATVSPRYRYSLCFENDVYPGYVTEKPFEAWAAGCIPLWRGSDPAGYVNPSAVINADEGGIDAMVQRVSELEQDPDARAALASRPILLRRPEIEVLTRKIQGMLTRQ